MLAVCEPVTDGRKPDGGGSRILCRFTTGGISVESMAFSFLFAVLVLGETTETQMKRTKKNESKFNLLVNFFLITNFATMDQLMCVSGRETV